MNRHPSRRSALLSAGAALTVAGLGLGLATEATAATTVPLTNTITRRMDNTPTIGVGSYTAMNNAWGAGPSYPGPWQQSIGAVPAGSGAAFRTKFSFPKYDPSREVLSYPEIVYGAAAGVAPRSASVVLPRKIGQISTLSAGYTGISGSATGRGHLSYDIWLQDSATRTWVASSRRVELMIPEYPVGGYGVPNWPATTTVGRTGPAAGRNPAGYIGRATVDGTLFDVYRYRKGVSGRTDPWDLVVYEPVTFRGTGPSRRNVKAFLTDMVNRGWANTGQTVTGVEFGYEAVTTQGGSTGDLTVDGFSVSAS